MIMIPEQDRLEKIQEIARLNEEAWQIRASDTLRSSQLAQEAYAYAVELNDQEGTAYSLANLARASHYDGENPTAMQQVLEAIEIFEKLPARTPAYCYALATQGMIHLFTDSEVEALKTSGKLFTIAQEEEFLDYQVDRKSTRLNSSHQLIS